MTSRTAHQRLATNAIGEDVVAWATRKRADGKPSWREIADELRAATDGEVNMVGESIRLWVLDAHGCDPADEAPAETEAVA